MNQTEDGPGKPDQESWFDLITAATIVTFEMINRSWRVGKFICDYLVSPYSLPRNCDDGQFNPRRVR